MTFVLFCTSGILFSVGAVAGYLRGDILVPTVFIFAAVIQFIAAFYQR